MIVAGTWPALNAAIIATVAWAGRPARAGTVDPGAARPCEPWQMAQPSARARAPSALTLAAANAGAAAAGGAGGVGGAADWARASEDAARQAAATTIRASCRSMRVLPWRASRIDKRPLAPRQRLLDGPFREWRVPPEARARAGPGSS